MTVVADLFATRTAASDDDAPEAVNFRLLGNRGLAKSWRDRAAANVLAIRLAAQIEAEKRPATEEEQEQLIRYVGFGASDLANGLFPTGGEGFRSGWQKIGEDLRASVTDAELAALARATQYAHYTPEYIVRSLWRGMRRMGFTGGAVIEPGCGVGIFNALMPEGIAMKSSFLGIEACPTTARIARLVHPESDILHGDFTRAKIAGEYDLAIGNPPFSSRVVSGEIGRPSLSLHDFFIARSVELLRAGGLAAFVVSRYTMDKQDPTAREYIAGMADLLAAVRLPQGSMRADAGTDVVVDLLFFRKRMPGDAPAKGEWLATTTLCRDGDVEGVGNAYFASHPGMALGTHAITSSQHGPTYTLSPKFPLDERGLGLLSQSIGAALEALPERIYTPATLVTSRPSVGIAPPALPKVSVGTAADGASLKEGSYFVGDDNELYQIERGTPVRVPLRSRGQPSGIFGTVAEKIRRLVRVRDAVRAILNAQGGNQPWEPHQTELRTAYDAFVRKFGPINKIKRVPYRNKRTGEEKISERRENLSAFHADPDCWLVGSIAGYDPDSGIEVPGPIFTRRVMGEKAPPIITNSHDALAVVLDECGRVDLARIADLLGKSEAQVEAELGDRIYFDPGKDTWTTADDYLADKVRQKLARAELAAEEDPRFRRNVEALRAVQPEDLKPSQITARLAASWIPVSVIEQFILDVLGINAEVLNTSSVGSWTVSQGPFFGKAAATSEWGTQRRHAGMLIEDALNSRTPRIMDTIREPDGRKRQELNVVETEAAKAKLNRIREAFEGWVWKDGERAGKLVRIYNDTHNDIVPREFDGSHLTLPGATNIVEFRAKQKRAVWRVIVDGTTYLAHAVGAGKTMAAIAAVMEQKRLGLISKTMVSVPGHTLAQWAYEWVQLYPDARIMVADEENFDADNRAQFLARAATDTWDAIIITHSAFKKIAAPSDFEERMVLDMIDTLEDALDAADANDRVTRKQIERMKEAFEAKLAGLASEKDDMVNIADLGIDFLVDDEAQEHRKLTFATNMSTLKGIDPNGSMRAWDLYVKSKFVNSANPGRALLMMSGTPIVNTMAELYTVHRFMDEAALHERKIACFDQWAAVFGEATTELELQPSGLYKPQTRFAKFVNVPELVALTRRKMDIVSREELRQYVKLPHVAGGERQLVKAEQTPAFKAYQRVLGQRIKIIEARKRPPQKGDDIILTVLNDGRHAAIDTRFVMPHGLNYPGNKLNLLIDKAHGIWQRTADQEYVNPATGQPYPLRGGAQMIFSDLGTEAAEDKRGFSAYVWIRQRLISMGVPPEQIVFMQHYKKADAKRRLFQSVNEGRVRFLIGSSETMGTGVNAQIRLKALHHLDVPYFPAWIEQREGRIERYGNQHEEVEVYAYATLGSIDATMWQFNERKARFIAAALSGDRSLRVVEDAGNQIDQFAMAKALASGDPRLMQLAGLESHVASLRRLSSAHFDDQHAVRSILEGAKRVLETAERRLPNIRRDLELREPTRADAFKMTIRDTVYTERPKVADILISRIRMMERAKETGDRILGKIGGFNLVMSGTKSTSGYYYLELAIERTNYAEPVKFGTDITGTGLLMRIEHQIERIDEEAFDLQRRADKAERDMRDYTPRLGQPFRDADELHLKETELAALKATLAANENATIEEKAA